MAEPHPRPLRSCFYVPADKPHMIDKALGLDADALILDLEDAVAPDNKPGARESVCALLRDRGPGGLPIAIRINPLDSDWGADDREAVLAAGARVLLLPKANGPGDLAAIAADGVALWAMIETPRAILSLDAIAVAPGLEALVVGTNDLAKELRAEMTPGRGAFLTALSMTVMAARANGIAAIDGVFNDIADAAGFADECAQGRALGFDGKTLIHPVQLDPCNRIFSPDAAAVDHARKVVAAFERPENALKGVIKVDGRMTERLHLDQARWLIALADRVKRR